MPTTTLFVTATHPHPDYRFDREPVAVFFSERDGFYARHSKLGCGKNRPTAEAAARHLFADHACAVVRIETETEAREARRAEAHALADAEMAAAPDWRAEDFQVAPAAPEEAAPPDPWAPAPRPAPSRAARAVKLALGAALCLLPALHGARADTIVNAPPPFLPGLGGIIGEKGEQSPMRLWREPGQQERILLRRMRAPRTWREAQSPRKRHWRTEQPPRLACPVQNL